jgi:hypothetical protein
MSTRKHILSLPLVFLLTLSHAQAQEGVQQPPPKYRMELVYIFEADYPEFIFVVGNAGFKSVAALKKFLGSLPPGSTLEWAPGCRRIGGEPLLSSEQEMEEFKAFCAEKNINFVLVPSG